MGGLGEVKINVINSSAIALGVGRTSRNFCAAVEWHGSPTPISAIIPAFFPTRKTMTPPRPIRILGIDPGSRTTGFGIIDVVGREQIYVVSGCIKTIKNDELAGRIGIIVENISEIIATYRPTVAAVERVFVNVNPASTLMLGQARGAAIAALVLHGLPVYEYTALQVKQAVVGQGKAAKEQVQHMVVQMLKLSGTPQADAADGLAIALTHALRNQGLAAKLGSGQVKGGRFQ